MLLVLLLAQAAPDLIAAARVKTAAATHCDLADTTAITVCGRRAADRYRVPLVEAAPLSRHAEPGGREAVLLPRPTPIERMSPFLVGGGMAGVRYTTRFGAGSGEGSATITGTRELAP